MVGPGFSRPALGSATQYRTIFQIREPWGAPRFHPPGEHPATYQWRQHRDHLLGLLEKYPRSAIDHPEAYRQTCEALAYIGCEIARFEAVEAEEKCRCWLYIQREASCRG